MDVIRVKTQNTLRSTRYWYIKTNSKNFGRHFLRRCICGLNHLFPMTQNNQQTYTRVHQKLLLYTQTTIPAEKRRTCQPVSIQQCHTPQCFQIGHSRTNHHLQVTIQLGRKILNCLLNYLRGQIEFKDRQLESAAPTTPTITTPSQITFEEESISDLASSRVEVDDLRRKVQDLEGDKSK